MTKQDQEGTKRGQRHEWSYDYLDDGSVVVKRDGEPLFVADSLTEALEELGKQLKSGEQEA